MSERHRSLPAWMAKKEEKSQEKKPLKRKRKAARSVFYCMNEQELVEAAVSYFNGSCEEQLTFVTHQQGKQKAVDTVKKMGQSTNSQLTANPVSAEESPSDCTEDLDMTCVSESDLDTTEVETLPYTSNPQHQTSERRHSGTVEDVEAGKTREPPQTAAEDSDALRLVREIFFS